MKKHSILWGLLLAGSILLFGSIRYQNLSDRESGAAPSGRQTTDMAQAGEPQETARATTAPSEETAPAAETMTPTQDEQPEENGKKYALWSYDKKTRRLTITGNGELLDDSHYDGDDYIPSFVPANIPPDYNYFASPILKAREVIIEPGITTINTSAFREFKDLEKITIPDTVREIKDYAFYYCTSLREITIPDQVETIGKLCFLNCSSLEQITLGKNVNHIGEYTFCGLKKLRRITLNPENPYLVIRDGILYHRQKKILYTNFTRSAAVTIKKGTKKIADHAFQWNRQVQRITIPASVTVIGAGAMSYCTNLRKVTFEPGSRLKKIEMNKGGECTFPGGENCFRDCRRLKQISLPDSLETAYGAFWSSSLKKIYFGKNFRGKIHISDTAEDIAISDENPFYCSRDGVVYSKDMDTLIAYPPCKKGVKFHIPKSVNKMLPWVFYHCKELQAIVIYNPKTKLRFCSLPVKGRKLTIYAPRHSTAQKYAKKHKRKFKFIAI